MRAWVLPSSLLNIPSRTSFFLAYVHREWGFYVSNRGNSHPCTHNHILIVNTSTSTSSNPGACVSRTSQWSLAAEEMLRKWTGHTGYSPLTIKLRRRWLRCRTSRGSLVQTPNISIPSQVRTNPIRKITPKHPNTAGVQVWAGKSMCHRSQQHGTQLLLFLTTTSGSMHPQKTAMLMRMRRRTDACTTAASLPSRKSPL